MPTNLEVQDAKAKWLDELLVTYQQVQDQMTTLGITVAEPMPDGSEAQLLPGMGSLLSHSDLNCVRDSIAWALSSWTASKTLPSGDQLFGFVQSMAGSEAAIICTLSSLVQIVSILVLVSSGGEDLVGAVSSLTLPEVVPLPTSPSTSPKISTDEVSTRSSRLTGQEIAAMDPPLPPVSRGTSSTSGKKRSKGKKGAGKGKSRKSPTRKGLAKKKARK